VRRPCNGGPIRVSQGALAAGVPTGGRFAAHNRTESDAALGLTPSYGEQVLAFADALLAASASLSPADTQSLRRSADPIFLADADEMFARRAAAEANIAFVLTDPEDADYDSRLEATSAAEYKWRAAERHAHEVRYLRNDPLAQKKIAVEVDVVLPTIHEALPKYPAGLDEAQVTFSYGDDDDNLYVNFNIGEGADQAAVTVWKDGQGDSFNSITDQEEITGWDPETDEQFIEWAHAVRDRIDIDTYVVALNATASAETSILTRATA